MNLSVSSLAAPSSPVGRVLSGKICRPIHHPDESVQSTARRLANRVRELQDETDLLELRWWSALLQSMFYGKETSSGAELLQRAERIRVAIREKQSEYKGLSTALRSHTGNGVQVEYFCGAPENAKENHALNNYEKAWASRLLRLASLRKGGSGIVPDDLRVALPEMATERTTLSNLLAFLDHLGLTLFLEKPDESLRPLISFIRQSPPPAGEVTRELINELINRRRAKTVSDQEASETHITRDAIIYRHLVVILNSCASYVGRGVDLLDLFQEGCIGLFEAIDHFDPEEGTPFRVYCGFWIRQALTRAIAEKARMVRLPVYVLERLAAIENQKPQRFGDDPDAEQETPEYAVETLLPIETIPEGDLAARAHDVTSFEDVVDEGVLEMVIEQALSTLKAQEARVLELRFGLKGYRPHTLEEIGQSYGVTRERIRQVEAKALKKLRLPPRDQILASLKGCL